MTGVSSLGIAALACSLALGCADTPREPTRPAPRPPAVAAPTVAPSAPVSPVAAVPGSPSAIGEARADALTAARSSPVQALNQLLTAQALLVSLLLAPVSKDAGQAPLARLDEPAP